MTIQDGYYAFDNDLNSIIAALNNCYVISGVSVAEDSPLDMGVVVAAGVYYANGTRVAKASETDLPLDASDPSLARKDLIVGDSAGTISFVKGTNAAPLPSTNTGPTTYSPVPPNIPADKTLLAEVWVGAGVNSIANASITGRRIVVTQHNPDASLRTFNITAYGAKGDGSIDDGPAVRAAQGAAVASGGGIVTWPTPPVYWNLLEDPGEDTAIRVLPKVSHQGTGYGCKVRGTGDYAIFKPHGYADYWKNAFISGFRIHYDGFQETWTKAKAIWIPDQNYDAYNFRLENIAVMEAFAGLWVGDGTPAVWGGYINTFRTYRCRHGIHIKGGTGWHLDRTYVQGGFDASRNDRGYYITNASTVVMSACAMDGYYLPASHDDDENPGLEAGLLIADVTGAQLEGFQFEANRSTEDGSILRFHNVLGLTISGMKGSDDNRLYVGDAATLGLVTFSGNTTAKADGMVLGGGCGDYAYGGTARAATVLVRDTAVMEISASNLSSLTIGAGTPECVYLAETGTAGGVILGPVAVSGNYYDPANRISWLRPDKGFVLPRFSTVERDAMTGVNGMVIYNTTTNRMEGYENGAWVDL